MTKKKKQSENKICIYLETLACLIRSYLLDKIKELPEGKNKYTDIAMDYIAKAIEYINRNFALDIKAADVARACNLSLSHLQHIFIEKTGTGVGDTSVHASKESSVSGKISPSKSLVMAGTTP